MLIIAALKGLRWSDSCEFEGRQGYTVKPCLSEQAHKPFVGFMKSRQTFGENIECWLKYGAALHCLWMDSTPCMNSYTRGSSSR